MPKVSICLPNLNNSRFLNDRFASILQQTFTNWECIVYDGFSDDGSWEIIRKFAETDSRIQAIQGPRKGIYDGMNQCLGRARGEYIYIATSDDTMVPQCLERMLSTLEEHPECGICTSKFVAIDERSRKIDIGVGQLWQSILGDLVQQKHIRPAPLDALLYATGATVHTSLTMILTRRSVFEKYGFFSSSYGSHGDVEWGMRVGLRVTSIYLPEELGTWRVHDKQATDGSIYSSLNWKRKYLSMAEQAIRPIGDEASLNRNQRTQILRGLRRSVLVACLRPRNIAKSIGLLISVASKDFALPLMLAGGKIGLSGVEYEPLKLQKCWNQL